jgi:hypothetical protein
VRSIWFPIIEGKYFSTKNKKFDIVFKISTK